MGKPSQPLTMLVPKANRQAVYKYLFKEGVMVAKKDFNKPKHGDPDLKTADGQEVPNLQVIKLMQSLKSRGFVTERFNWNWYYYYLTNEGIDYLQKFLNLPADVVPATLKKSTRPASRPSAGGERPSGKGGYGKGGDYQPRYAGGRGGGRGGGGFGGN